MRKRIVFAFLLTTLGALNTQPAFDDESKTAEKTKESARVENQISFQDGERCDK